MARGYPARAGYAGRRRIMVASAAPAAGILPAVDEPARATTDERDESRLQRADRNMAELLQELRVVQAGVQILFGFLLSLSFTERFARIDAFQRWTWVVTLLLSVVTAGLLVAPAAVHRITFRRGLKPETVQFGHRLFACGLVALALTLAGAVLLVLDVAVGRSFAVVVAGAVGVFLIGLWFLLPAPLLRRTRAEDDDGEGPPPGDRRAALS